MGSDGMDAAYPSPRPTKLVLLLHGAELLELVDGAHAEVFEQGAGSFVISLGDGDHALVVGGIPEPIDDHLHRLACEPVAPVVREELVGDLEVTAIATQGDGADRFSAVGTDDTEYAPPPADRTGQCVGDLFGRHRATEERSYVGTAHEGGEQWAVGVVERTHEQTFRLERFREPCHGANLPMTRRKASPVPFVGEDRYGDSMRRPSDDFMGEMAALEDAYLTSDEPIEQSGFSGGPKRWREERGPILDAVFGDGHFLDVGCANGYLLECLSAWAAEAGIQLTPHGLELGSRLVESARRRHSEHAGNINHGDVWNWQPPRTYDYVYTLSHLAPPGLLGDLCRRLATWVSPGGRLIVGDYGSRRRGIEPQDMRMVLKSLGFEVAGASVGGDPIMSAFAWVDC